MTRVMVTGGRDWADETSIRLALGALQIAPPVTLIHGDCLGADRIAARVALTLGWSVRAYPADWKRFPDDAALRRNRQMVDTKPDYVVAFPTRRSRGTWHAVGLARDLGLRVIVVEAVG